MDVAHDPGAAAHVGDFRVVVVGAIILLVKGRVQEAEIGKEPLGGGFHGQLEEVVVGFAGFIVNPFFDLEDLHRENGGFAISQTCFCRQEEVLYDHARFGGSVGAVVYGAEGDLRAGPGIHGVEVMNEGFHGLIGGVVGGFRRGADGEIVGRARCLRADGLIAAAGLVGRKKFHEAAFEVVSGGEADIGREIFFDGLRKEPRVFQRHAQGGREIIP